MEIEKGVTVEEVTDDQLAEDEEDGFDELAKFFEDDDDDADEEEIVEEETEEEIVEEEEVVEEEPVQPAQPKSLQDRLAENFSQEEMNQLFGNARIQGRELAEKVERLQHITGGLNLDQILDHLASQQVEELEQEHGLSRELAQEFVENKQIRHYLEPQLQKLHQQQMMTATMASYNNEKARFLTNPMVKKYEAEIDAVSQGGQRLGFEAAMKYVLGEKVVAGELAQTYKDAAQQKALKDAAKKPRQTPEGASAGGAVSQSIPPDLRKMAQLFGNDPKSVAKQYQKLKRTPI